MAQGSYADIAKMYAEKVVAGEILACKWVKAACQRQLSDLKKYKGKASPYRFNPKLTSKSGKTYYPADNLCAFIERLPHVKGPLAGEPITLEPWQVFILSTVFGWVKADGTLAGSVLSMDQALRNLVHTLGLSLADASSRVSTFAADHMGLADRGRLQTGAWADAVVLNRDLQVQAVVVEGYAVRNT